MRAAYLAVGVCMLRFGGAHASTPHSHDGILQPYDGAPPEVALTELEQRRLRSGEPVYKRVEGSESDQSAALFRVDAPVGIVWSVISNFACYPQWVDGLAEAEIYRREGSDVFIRFRIEHGLAGSYTYYVHHTFATGQGRWTTWKLDYGRQSDFDDSVGFWRVRPATDNPQHTYVTYSAALRLKGWLPGLFESLLANNGLKQATSWVKLQSEARVGQGGEESEVHPAWCFNRKDARAYL